MTLRDKLVEHFEASNLHGPNTQLLNAIEIHMLLAAKKGKSGLVISANDALTTVLITYFTNHNITCWSVPSAHTDDEKSEYLKAQWVTGDHTIKEDIVFLNVDDDGKVLRCPADLIDTIWAQFTASPHVSGNEQMPALTTAKAEIPLPSEHPRIISNGNDYPAPVARIQGEGYGTPTPKTFSQSMSNAIGRMFARKGERIDPG